MANILRQLSDEHEEVTRLLEALGDEDADRFATFEELYRNLLAHSKAEEQELYALVRSLDEEIASKVEDSFQEHQEVEKLLEVLKRQLRNNEKFAATLEDLKDTVEHHVDEEEGELFPIVEQHLSDEELEELAAKFIEARRAVVEAIGAVDDEMIKEELYEEARKVEIEGRSTMIREELEEQLRKK